MKKTAFAAVLTAALIFCAPSAFAGSPRYRPADENVNGQTPFRIHAIREVQHNREIERLQKLGPAAEFEEHRVGDPEPVGIDAALRPAA